MKVANLSLLDRPPRGGLSLAVLLCVDDTSPGGIGYLPRRDPGITRHKSGDRVDDFFCCDNGGGVVRDVDVERGVHLHLRVAGGRVFDDRDLVAELGGEAHRGLYAGVRDKSDDDKLMNAVPRELRVQIGAGEATGPPMLEGHDLARLRGEFAADLAAPRPGFERLMHPGRLLDRRDVLPGLVVAGTVSTMQRVEDTKARLPRSIQHL